MSLVYQYTCESKRMELAEIAEKVRRINATLVTQRERYFDGSAVILLIFEKYYMRADGYASLTVLLSEDGPVQNADVIGYGGGQGLLNLSWGANEDFADMAADILEKCGFVLEQ